MLPCIHTFCLECLKQTGDATKKEPGEKMPCPLCRRDFVIPAEGMNGLQRNFFMQHLIDVTTRSQLGQQSVIDCDICKVLHEGDVEKTKEATMHCLECQDNFCDMCAKTHKLHKSSKSHSIVKIGVNTDEDLRRMFPSRKCISHNQKPLEYYCVECKQIVCVTCLLEKHASHKYKDVTTIEEEFRQTIEENRLKISSYADGILLKAEYVEQRKTDFLTKLEEIELEIQRRNQELKELIDKHTKSLFDELGTIRQKHIKGFEKEKEEIERFNTILKSFESYSTELHSKGSVSDICSSINEILARSDELEKDHKTFLDRPCRPVEVSFAVTPEYESLLAKRIVVGRIQDTGSNFENNLVMVGLNTNGCSITNDAIKINLHRLNEVSNLQQLPSTCRMVNEAAAAIHDNTIYLTGIGKNWNEIWKYNSASGWVKCCTLIQGRRGHCVAFIDGVLYICGGFYVSAVNVLWNMFKGDVDAIMGVLDSVEAYDVVANNYCTTVGKLVYGINSSGNCVPFKSSLHMFGGIDKSNQTVSHVQVFNTKQNTCTLLSKPMPRGYHLMRAAVWNTSVILLGHDTCFIFNFETENWQERKQFKTDVVHFGLALESERIFVIGGGTYETDRGATAKWKLRNDVRYVPVQNILDDKPIEWKINATLPGGTSVSAYGVLREFV